MKLRYGFVSNSSTTSFSIYGWKVKELGEYLFKDNPLLRGCEIAYDTWNNPSLLKNLIELYDGNEYDIASCAGSDGDFILGVGSNGTECDHLGDPPINGKHYYSPPTVDKTIKIDEIAKKYYLPSPKLYQETFYE